MSKTDKYLLFGSIILILGASIVARAWRLGSYTSEMDDHIVAVSILNAKKPVDINRIRYSINDTSKSTYNSVPKKLLRKIDEKKSLPQFLGLTGWLTVYFSVPNQTTYAPAQFFFTQFLIDKDQDLRSILFRGRLPSFILSIAAIILFFYFIRRRFNPEKNGAALAYAFLILALSCEFIIYSHQMESYAAGPLAFILYSFLLTAVIKAKKIQQTKKMILFGILSALMVWIQYQMLFFVAAGYLALIVQIIRSRSFNKITLKNGLFSILFFLVFFLPIYLLFISKHTEHVAEHLSGGSKAAYFFPYVAHSSSPVTGIVLFFIEKSWVTFKYMTTFLLPDNWSLATSTFAVINILLFTGGIIGMLKDKDPNRRFYYIFLLFSFCIWLAIVIKGTITLSPNRHSLILLPAFCIFIYCGFSFFMNTLLKTPRARQIAFIIPALALVLFSFTYPGRLKERKEPFLDPRVMTLLDKYKPDCIVSKDNIVFLMPELYKKYDVFFKSDDKSLEQWLSRKNTDTVYQRFAVIDMDVNAGRHSTASISPPGSEAAYQRIESLAIDSETDEIHKDFTRYVTLRINIFEKTK